MSEIAKEIRESSKELKRLFYIDGSDLRWNVQRGNIVPGSMAGSITSSGYRQVCLYKSKYQSHRIVYKMIHDSIDDDKVVDHIDENKINNAPDNLQLLSVGENTEKSRIFRNNK